MVRALGPESRTMPMPPRPGGVEMATMVSFSMYLFEGTASEIFAVVEGAFLAGSVLFLTVMTWLIVW